MANFHLIEAFDHWRDSLETVCAKTPGFSYTLAAAGPEDGETWFTNDREQPLGGVARQTEASGFWKVRQVAIDRECERLKLPGPFLLKLDTHGFERPILEGARETLRSTSIAVIEMYNFQTAENRFPAMCLLMEELGFRCIDISEPLFRDYDDAFWQMDFYFIKANRPEFKHAQYR